MPRGDLVGTCSQAYMEMRLSAGKSVITPEHLKISRADHAVDLAILELVVKTLKRLGEQARDLGHPLGNAGCPEGTPLYGGVMPETYPTLRAARRDQRRLARTQPARPNPFRGGVRKPVRYVVFARREEEVHGL